VFGPENPMRTPVATALSIALVVATIVLAAGCEKKGSAERAGKQIDRALDDLRDAARRATK
jgi:hypothetical protein